MTSPADLSREVAIGRAEKVQGALYRIAELASAAQDMQEFYRAIQAVVGELMYAKNFYIALYDDERQLISWPYYIDELDTDLPSPNEWAVFGEGQARGATAYVLRTGLPQLLTREPLLELVEQGEFEISGAITEDSSWLGVPLKSEGRAVGVLVVQSYTKDVQYSEQDKELLAFVGQHVGSALSRARAIEETRQRNAELELINSVQAAIAGELDLQAIYDLVGDKIQEVFDAQVVAISTLDETRRLLRYPYILERGERLRPDPIPLGGFSKHVLETREPLLITENVDAESERYGSAVVAGEGAKSVLFVPLVTGGHATGLVSLQNLDRERAFAESDQRLLVTLAGSLSAALENARLVHETRQRNAELALINSVQEALAGELELQAIYDIVGDKIQEIFDAQVVDIGIFDFDAGVTRFPYAIERGVRFPDEPVPIVRSPTTQLLVETKSAVLINDVPAWEMECGVQIAVLQGEPALSVLIAPLTSGEDIRGRISLQNLDRANAFSDSDARLLTTLAGSLSVALENARLVHETRQRNAELALINSVQSAIAGELDQQAIYDLVGDKIQEIFDAQAVHISTLDEATGLLHIPYLIERGERMSPDPFAPAGFSKHVLETREPLMITENVAAEAERYGSRILAGEAPQSILFVPLIKGGRATGLISLQNVDREHAFGGSDERLLVTLAGSLSVALENARLVHETRQRNAELALINSVQSAIAGELDPQAIYDLVGDKIREIFDAQTVIISTLDEATRLAHFPYVIERGERLQQDPIPLSGFSKHVLETREPLMINEDVADAFERYDSALVGGGERPKSVLFVPLVTGGRATGVISLQNVDREHAFTESEERLLGTLAGSLSVALENARLVHETRQRVAELGTVNSVGQALASQLDLDALVELVGDKLQEVFEADIVYVALHDEVAAQIDFAYYSEDGERQEQPPIEYGQGLTSRILESREPLLLNRSEQWEELATARMGTPSLSYLGVPIFVGDKAIGVISVQSTRETGRFGESDGRLLSTLAANVGSAIQNARLYRETRRRANETATLAELGREVSAMLDLTAVLGRIGERAQDLLEAETSAVYLAGDDGKNFHATIALGKNAAEVKADTIAVGEGIIGDLAERGAAEAINDTSNDPRVRTIPGTSEEEHGRLMAAPLLARERVIGMMAVWRYAGSPFTEEDLSFLVGLSQQAAIAIENARLFEEQGDAERKYRELVEQLPLTVYRDFPDVAATSEYISPRVETMFGYPPEAWMNSEFFPSVLHPDDRERVLTEQGEWLSGNVDRWTNEYRVIAADGRTVWVRDDAWIVKDDKGKPSRVHGFMIDVTEQALAQGEIRRQKQYFESLVDVSPVAIVVMDANERVTGWNPAAAELFGWPANEAVGRHIDDLVFQEAAGEAGREVTREAREAGRAQRIGRRARKDGQLVDVELMLVPLEVDGKHVGFYAIYHDITELQRAREEAETATQAKSAFLATMSHEIRTPMNAVIGMTGLLLGTELTTEQREFAEVVRSSGDALLHVIDDILDYSKIEAGKLELEKEPVDLRECVEGALEIVAPRAWEKEIELGCLIDEEAPAGIVGDAARLRQVLLNLLSNAVKFTEDGEVVVHVDSECARSKSYRLHLAVRDTGIGIPQSRMNRLFASFSQVDASTTRRYGGTGLGLAISKRLVELMGGTMWVESEEGKGSTFHIELIAKEAEVPARITEPDGLPQLRGKRILIVDDNATNREIVTRHARSWEMEPVAIASSPESLARIADGEAFDVAVLDMMMPELDGLALAREIRRHRDERELPLVLLTSLGRLPQAQSSGEFVVQLAKPVRASQLYNALLRALSGRAGEPEAAGELGGEHGKPATSPLRILLAEDNAVNQKVALRLLDQLGYRADVASNGREALDALERKPYDVVLMDVQMPELDGLGASRQICERWPAEIRPRIIAMTANALPEDREACFAAGMDDYVAKPIRPNELAAALHRVRPREGTGMTSAENGGAQAGLDTSALDSLRELGGEEFVAEVIDTFLADAPALVAMLRTTHEQGDTEELRRAAHTLKSNGATLGAGSFSELCRELEGRARSGELDGTAELLDRIEREYGALEATLAALRSAPRP